MKIILIGNLSSTVILFREKLIRKLKEKNAQIYTLTMDKDPANFRQISSYGAYPDSYIFSRSGLNPISDIINTYRLYKKIKHIKPDIVLCFFPKPVIFGTLAARLARVKKIYSLLEGLGFCYTEHLNNEGIKKSILKKIQTFLYRISLPFASKVLFLNDDDYKDLIIKNNIPIQSYDIIGGIGVDLKKFQYTTPKVKPMHFGMVSRLLVEKGVREFVAAARILKEKYPNIQFSIAGSVDDNPGGITLEQVNSWKKENLITFLGQLVDINEYLNNISVFVLPSYREGVPRSTQEAMAVGRPVITTDVPGCRETVHDGVNGFMIPPWDIKALVEAMDFFILNPEKVIEMGKESRIIAEEKFDDSAAASKLIQIFNTDD
ncbi:TPA: glycosyltransferase family 4 protein [Salmonella enterica subsp. houtenae]|nr:glycosyltransferase family 4 protein [Salmonella enterica subsp. houtenae]ECT3982164.1 glycosyltransferase family 1 protein [Salmonella enterica subsp. houtenae serovar 53:z4,z23:-]EKO1018322.1 glycosyltransferase family 4 protein [Salmonella enterica subsp. enterica]ECF6025002.1 glycosyltransferase family 4 protein [Salmonella enterica subsp. houtenae]ECJ2498297.1 glycosyltransferase family 4 protein [Salmonella enterica subsp. houtenae]